MKEARPPFDAHTEIREMTIDDLSAVFHIGEEIFTAESAPTLYRTWDEYEVTTLFNTDGELCLVAEQNDTVCGFILGTTVTKHGSAWTYGYVIWLGVHPDSQKGKIGEKLFKVLKERMIERGVRILIMDTDAKNKGAIRFFRNQGFGKARQHVYMSLNLDREGERR